MCLDLSPEERLIENAKMDRLIDDIGDDQFEAERDLTRKEKLNREVGAFGYHLKEMQKIFNEIKELT